MTNAVAVTRTWAALPVHPDRHRSGALASWVIGSGDGDDTSELDWNGSTHLAVQPSPSGALLVPPLSTPPAQPTTYYTVTTVDARGRLADASPLRVLGWAPGQPITIAVAPGWLIAVARPDGTVTVTRQGHLRLPADLRHALRLTRGDRLLVAAHPDRGVLAAYTIATVDAMVTRHHVAAGGASP